MIEQLDEYLRELSQEARSMPCMDELDAEYWGGRLDAIRAVQRFIERDED